METLNLFNIGYILLIAIASTLSFKAGEKSGSNYMLEYLRKEKYKNSDGIEVSFFDDTGFYAFMRHVRKEKRDREK